MRIGPHPLAWNLPVLGRRRRELIANPGWEVDGSGYISSGGNTTARSTEQAHSGVASGKCTYGATGTGCAVYGITLPGPRTYMASVWVYIPAAFDGGGIRLEPTGFTGISLGTVANRDANMGLRDQWQQLSQAFTVAADITGDVRLSRQGAAPSVSGVIYADDFSLK